MRTIQFIQLPSTHLFISTHRPLEAEVHDTSEARSTDAEPPDEVGIYPARLPCFHCWLPHRLSPSVEASLHAEFGAGRRCLTTAGGSWVESAGGEHLRRIVCDVERHDR